MARVLDSPVSSESPKFNGTVFADTVSGVARKGDRNEWRSVMRMIV